MFLYLITVSSTKYQFNFNIESHNLLSKSLLLYSVYLSPPHETLSGCEKASSHGG